MFALLLHEGMDPFYRNIASFPTVLFTVLLAVCLVYWLCAVLGFVDIDLLDVDTPELEGDLGDTGTAHGGDEFAPNALAGLMMKLGLNGVPLTVIVSFIALFGWVGCFFAVHFLFALVPEGLLRYLAGVPVLLVTLYVAALITSVVIRPLRPLFKAATQNAVKHVLGQTAVVRTSYVDESFGEASLDDGGAGLILKVRASADASFKKGDRVVLLEYRKDSNTYRVVSEEEFSG